MIKKTFKGVTLTCLFQGNNVFTSDVLSETVQTNPNVLSGMLSKLSDNNILFQENTPNLRVVRNHKIYEGSIVSLVHRKDNRYYLLLKSFNPEEIHDIAAFANRISVEVNEAINTIM